MTQICRNTEWHETVRKMRMNGSRTSEIADATGYTNGTVNKVIGKYRGTGTVFPPIEGSNSLEGISPEDWPNAVHMLHISGTMENGGRITCHSQIRADAVAEIEGNGGVVDV